MGGGEFCRVVVVVGVVVSVSGEVGSFLWLWMVSTAGMVVLVLEVVCGGEFDYCRGGVVGGDWWWWCRKWWCLWPLVMMGKA
jgi:hypothetical protein